MKNATPRRHDTRRGAAMVEFALTMTVLLLVAAGAADFSRMFLESMMMVGASANGVKYGAQNVVTSAETDVMAAIARANAEDASGVVETVERLCDCPGSPGEWINCFDTTCPAGYGMPRAYVRVRMSKTFETLSAIPGVPNDVSLQIESYMRVQ